MPYVVTENCILCRYTDCVVVCPVDCFHQGENMLAIDPVECIDCGVCEPECPARAIVPHTTPGIEIWRELNDSLSKTWPKLTSKVPPLPDHEEMDGKPGKQEHISMRPGTD